MTIFRLQLRSLLFFWRTNLGVMLGAAVGTAVLTGSLLVGDSMRESLRQMILGRLGRVNSALVAPQFFRESIASADRKEPASAPMCPLILVSAAVTRGDESSRVNRVNVFGVDDRFWKLAATRLPLPNDLTKGVVLNQPLADELGVKPGESVLIHMAKPSDASLETLLGRRDETTASMRIEVAGIIPARDLGAFDLNPRQAQPFNAFVPLADLQHTLRRIGKVNALLSTSDGISSLASEIRRNAGLADYGLTVRADDRDYISLESERMLIAPAAEKAAFAAAANLKWNAAPVIAYLANSIERASAEGEAAPGVGRSVPYSTSVAIDPQSSELSSIFKTNRIVLETLGSNEIALNQWTVDQIGAKPGDQIRLTYYVSGDFGRLDTEHAEFALRAVLPMSATVSDPGFVPQYHGITDAKSLSDWNPPFPIDLTRIRPADEDYWKQFHTAPKAFVCLADGEKLWAHQAERFGRFTSIRIRPPATTGSPDTNHADNGARFEAAILTFLKPEEFGLVFQSIRQQAVSASEGATDFGMLFVSFSFFLILVAAMLVALLFRLGIEQRSGEVGVLLATGYRPRTIGVGLIREGALIALIGGIFGSVLAGSYAWLMLSGLRTWWSAGLNNSFLELHGSFLTYAEGLIGNLLIAVFSIAWSIRGLTKLSPRALLAGRHSGESLGNAKLARKIATVIATACFLGAFGVIFYWWSGKLSQVVSFFIAAGLLLIGGAAIAARWLSGSPGGVVYRPGFGSLMKLAARNAVRHRGRSLLTVCLFASATFLIVSLESIRSDANEEADSKNSGTGGFNLIAESTVPILVDLNNARAREDLGINALGNDGDLTFVPFRLRPGDQSSCLNLYQPRKPRILGTTEAMIARGGFKFSSSIEATEAEMKNPWLLLNRVFPDGAIPAIGDEAAVQWQMHLGLAQDLELTDENGRPLKLRFVALLKESAVQDEVFISEAHFKRVFPSISGYSFFLIECPALSASAIDSGLEKRLSAYGFDAVQSRDRLNRYMAVQNAYLSTFQTLGGIALILGAAGLSAVMLRNIVERRTELALMQTLGFSRHVLVEFVLAENIVLLLIGLSVGSLAAFVAVAPHLIEFRTSFPWVRVGVAIAGTIGLGLLTAFLSVTSSLRGSLIASLRSE
ncbi:MAG: ABC transporter permease [Planctomycetes bacterium]|nr:ABC transporter permease [Planctomycetota bacterium]MBI3834031.1 ABC transporter permease [Planctomycetota bacterium]